MARVHVAPETAMASALKKAGVNVAERRLRDIATDALKKHHYNAGRSERTFAEMIADDADVQRELRLHYLLFVAKELGLPGNGQGAVETHDDCANARQPKPIVTPKSPTASQVAAMVKVAKESAITVLDSFKVRDGRAIGDVRVGELERLRSANAMEASVVRQIQRLGVFNHDARVRDVVKPQELQRIIQRAAEVADAA